MKKSSTLTVNLISAQDDAWKLAKLSSGIHINSEDNDGNKHSETVEAAEQSNSQIDKSQGCL